MGVTKVKSQNYYADYHDAAGRRRRFSLQTKNLRVAQLKYEELIRRRDAIKERMPVNITWDAFKGKLFLYLERERSHNTVTRMRLAIRQLEKVFKPYFLHDITPEILQRTKGNMVVSGMGRIISTA